MTTVTINFNKDREGGDQKHKQKTILMKRLLKKKNHFIVKV